MRDGSTTLSEESVSARRVRRVRTLRWLRGLRTLALMLIVAAVPITLALVLTGEDESSATTAETVPAEVLVRNFEGSGSMSTGVFVVGSDWVLKWRLDGLASDSLEISVRAAGGQDLDTVVQDGLGSGERAFDEGGAYRLAVTSTGDWNIRVLQVAHSDAG